MAKLTEINEFTEEVYRIEVTDFIEGGENGVDNLPHKALTNRTKWLKSKIDAFIAGTVKVKNAILADTTTKLATPRKINGVLFDGSADITIADTTKEPTITILPIAKGGTGKSTALVKADVGLSNVDNTADLAKPISTATQTALNAKEPTISILPIAKGGTGKSTALVKADVGLSNVDNTADLAKPISTATQTALNAKEPTISILPIAKGGTGKSTALVKADVGLSNVDNTADLAKPISTATQTALNAKAPLSLGVTQVLTSTGGYRVEPADTNGKRLITQWGKVTTNSANYAVTFPTAFTTTPSSIKIDFEEPTYNSSFAPSYFATNSRTKTGFKITLNGSGVLGGAILWEAKGY